MKKQFYPPQNDFVCRHCGNWVSVNPLFSGVRNRNHCPYCLWSRHVDWYAAGDRMSACKGGMAPVGLTFKRERKRYRGAVQGELMLVHRCTECGAVSINRLAADDDAQRLIEVFEFSLQLDAQTQQTITLMGVELLNEEHQWYLARFSRKGEILEEMF